MMFLYLVLKAIWKAGQLCLTALPVLVFFSCVPEIIPSRPDEPDERDSTYRPDVDTVYVDTTEVEDTSCVEKDPVLVFQDEQVNAQYWRGAGEGLKIRKPGMDSEEWFLVEPDYTFQGNDLYVEVPRMFGIYIQPSWSEDFKGEICLAYIDDKGSVLGCSHSLALMGNKGRSLAFYDVLPFPEGRIRVLPVVRPYGKEEWIAPVASGYYRTWYLTAVEEHELEEWPDEDWGFTLKRAREDLLELRDMYLPCMGVGSYKAAYGNSVKVGEDFEVEFILSNLSGHEQKGILLLVDEHGFSEGFHCWRPCQKVKRYADRELEEWSEVIGQRELLILEGTTHWKGRITGRLSYANYLRYCTSVQHLYFLPEGEKEPYLLIKDWRPVMYNQERGSTIDWGANVTLVKSGD